MNENSGLIELQGYPKKIINKTSKYLTFVFDDTNLGCLILVAFKNQCPLYYQLEKDKKYHLLVKLKGWTKFDDDGNELIFNALSVKRLLKGGDDT